MSNIKSDAIAKVGLGGILSRTTKADPEPIKKDTPEVEELSAGIQDEETRERLKKERERRQYLGAGRPKKDSTETPQGKNYTRRTFMVNKEKMAVIEEIAEKEELFHKEIIERAMDLVIAEYKQKGKIGE